MDRRPVLALVPARGGSKGMPRKNLALLSGKPLLAHTVEAALACPGVDAVYVSSDDDEILSLARSLGARPLPRPPQHATDEASAVGVVEHFLDSLPPALRARDPLVVYLQPTSPLRRAPHIAQALAQIELHRADSLVSVVELAKSPFKSFRIDERGRLQSLFDERQSNMRRQDLPRCVVPNGAIYAFTSSAFAARGGFPSNGALPYAMSDADSVDIDSPEDLARAEQMLGVQHA